MKILAVGDLHGRCNLVDRAEREFLRNDYDKLIFMGDYVDSDEGYTFNEQIACIDKVTKLKLAYPDEVEALLGNHDWAYLHNDTGISGFNAGAAPNFRMALNEGFFTIAWQHKNWIFTHAGINKGWYKRHLHDLGWVADKSGATNLAETLNDLVCTRRAHILYEVGLRRGGFYNTGGPLWADKLETWTKPLEGYNQVVGHTRLKAGKVVHKVHNSTIIYIDCLDENEDDEFNFLGIDLDEPITGVSEESGEPLEEDRGRS